MLGKINKVLLHLIVNRSHRLPIDPYWFTDLEWPWKTWRKRSIFSSWSRYICLYRLT